MSDKRKVKGKVVVETTPELAFEAVTQASELREWFSDGAWTQVRPGGRYALHWNQGYHVEGKFVELDPPHRAVVTWQGTGEPGETRVKFKVKPVDEGVKVSVVHKGFGPGDEWDGAVEEAEKGWRVGLENLKSTLETGVDLRIARQPFLGIYLGELDAERAAKEGIAVDQGIYVNGVVEGSGAEEAGLGEGDVMVALGGVETPGYQELGDALQAHEAGDVVAVDLVRGQERETVEIELGQRPQADVPDTAEALAERVAEQYREADAKLTEAVAGLGEEEAGQIPEGEVWSVKHVLAHLSVTERNYLDFLTAIALDGWRDGGSSNPTAMLARLEAVLANTPTVEGLLARIEADEAEMVAFLRRLPDETLAHKARFHRITQIMAYHPLHAQDHVGQIECIIEAVRGG